ncbi:MFS transporter [Microbulbifer sp. 2205BS26-8]|uniref:MFS transporter n=1 Tax=Microbulbifer sp. 2205BS26-8 TaxID=3064386 RepID=UPI00273DF12C|nr:MFS transporter [Microbulbifer sp. 2205BS26-8]MDP5208546.1 MFS transporter [Microbulbifer sp. 2205BS26-8]
MSAVKKLLKTPGDATLRAPSTGGILTALCLATLLNALAVSSVNIALPELVASLGTTYGRAQWIIIAFVMLLTATLAIAGQASDRIGRKNIFVHGMAIFTLSTLLCAISTHIWMLVFFRALQGIGAAMFVAVSMAIASDTFSKSRVGMAVGLLGSVSAVGTGMGPILGGFLLEVANWQAVFLVKVPLGIAIYGLAKRYLPADSGVKPGKTTMGLCNILSIISIFSAIFFYTLSIKPLNDSYGAVNILAIVISGLSLVALLFAKRRLSRKTSSPCPRLGSHELYTNLASNGLVGASVMSSLVVGPFYLTLALGLNFSQAGLVMSVGSFAVAICSNIAGRLVDRFKSRGVVLMGLGFLALGALGMTRLDASEGVLGYLACSIAMAIGYGTYLSSNNTFTMNSAAEEVRGSVSGLLNLSRNLGLLTGASLMSVVFAGASQLSYMHTADTDLVVAGLHKVYGLTLLLLVTALIAQAVVILFGRNKKWVG